MKNINLIKLRKLISDIIVEQGTRECSGTDWACEKLKELYKIIPNDKD